MSDSQTAPGNTEGPGLASERDGRGRTSLYSQFEQVAEGVADSIILSDRDRRVHWANAAACRMFGMTADELIGRRCDELAKPPAPSSDPPGEDDRFACNRVLRTGESSQGSEQTILRPDGSEIVVLIGASPLLDENGRVVGVINSLTDISGRKRAEDELLQRDEYNQSLLRLYALLGQANSYASIVAALRAEIPQTLGYAGIALALAQESGEGMLMLEYQGEGVEKACEDIMELGDRYSAGGPADTFVNVPIRGDRMMEEIATATHIVVVDDARTDPRTDKAVVEAVQNRTIINIPLILAEKRLGTVFMGTFGDEGVQPPTQRQLDYMSALSNHVAVAMDRVRFLSERHEAEIELEDIVGRLEELLSGVVDALASTTRQRDPYTGFHQERVSVLACAIADDLGLRADVIDSLRTAALLHDIGKISVPIEILSKPGVLSEMEMGLVRTHARAGYELLEHVPFGRPIAMAVLQHHERLDGTGYPDGIMGDEMLLESRILAVADVVEAMSSFRPYRPALGTKVALAEIEANAGTKYDPDVVAACTRVVRANPDLL